MLDLCSGSGVQAITALRTCPAAHLTLVDVSERAARFAMFNLRLNGLGPERATLLRQALGEEGEGLGSGGFDLVVANPPFVPNPAGCADCAAGALFGNGGPRGDASPGR